MFVCFCFVFNGDFATQPKRMVCFVFSFGQFEDTLKGGGGGGGGGRKLKAARGKAQTTFNTDKTSRRFSSSAGSDVSGCKH